MTEFEFYLYLGAALFTFLLNTGYSLVRLMTMLKRSRKAAAAGFFLLMLFGVLVTSATVVFVFALGLAHYNIEHYSNVARWVMRIYPIVGIGYFFMQRWFYRSRTPQDVVS